MQSESPTHPDAPRAGGETPTTLKPCPFCGGDEANGYLEVMNENEGIGNENGGEATPYYRVVCHECNGLTEGGRLESHAIAAWNRRAALPSLLERHRDGEWESANAADLTGARWYCEHCDAWGTVEIVRLPQLDAENLVCLKCRYQVAAFIPAPKHAPAMSAPPSPERASK